MAQVFNYAGIVTFKLIRYKPKDMFYESTRGLKIYRKKGVFHQFSFGDVIIEGIAEDGGLFVPYKIDADDNVEYPKYSVKKIEEMRDNTYPELATEIMSRFAGDDIARDDLEAMVSSTYTEEKFGSCDITPVTEIMDDVYCLNLSMGPTRAFKDIALQLLLELMDHELEKRDSFMNVILASSGDTYSAAEHAAIGKKRIAVFGITPQTGMSAVQEWQGRGLNEPNIFNLAMNGPFDDGQDIVKEIFADQNFKKEYKLGALNSINWGRIAAQVVYYFKAYYDVTDNSDQLVDFSVPSGNFGDVLAGYIAKRMGLNIRKLIVATNENSVLDTFISKGLYRTWTKDEVLQTSSPSMDISKASNFERLLYDATDRDENAVAAYMSLVNNPNVRGFNLAGLPAYQRILDYGFDSGSSSHKDRLSTIRQIYEDSGYLIDPHTADGIYVGLSKKEDGIPLVCLETANWSKFEPTIREALPGITLELPSEFQGIEKKQQFYTTVDADKDQVMQYIRENAIRD